MVSNDSQLKMQFQKYLGEKAATFFPVGPFFAYSRIEITAGDWWKPVPIEKKPLMKVLVVESTPVEMDTKWKGNIYFGWASKRLSLKCLPKTPVLKYCAKDMALGFVAFLSLERRTGEQKFQYFYCWCWI